MSDQTWWYIARSGGIVAWALLTMSMLWGLALSTKVLRGKPRPNWILDLHRFVGGLAVVFTGVHVIALLFDKYVTFTVVNLFVPFTGSWHPVAVGWGVIGAWLLAAVEVTSLLRKRLTKRQWRTVHYLSFPLFVLASVHALSAGTDRATVLLRVVFLTAVALIALLTLIRINKADDHDLLTSPRTAAARSRAGSA